MPERAEVESEVQLLGNQVLARLAQPGEPTAETLRAAQRLFAAAGEAELARWAECELNGYGGSGAVPVGAILGVEDEAPLAAAVRGYRQYVGRVRTATPATRQLQLPYFFGEGLETLRHYRANADAIGVDFIEVEVVSSGQAQDPTQLPAGAPARTLEFPRYTFYRILSGLAVELELAVRDLLKRSATPA